MKHPIRRRFMYLGFRGLQGLIGRLPLIAARRLGRALGLVAYGLLGDQRRLTQHHLALAFGEELTGAQRRRIARQVFVNLGQNAMEWLVLPRLLPATLRGLVTAQGLEHIQSALAQGRGAILVAAHFGNWEIIPLYLRSLGFEGGVLARRLRYPEYESFLVTMRSARGISTFARGSLKDVAKALRANRIVGMLPDQDIDSLEGIFVSFLGRPAHTPVGPAALSLVTGAPIVPCFLIRDGDRFRLSIEPALAAPRTADRAEAIRRLTEAWSAIMESYIRRYPDHWVWMHRRWKTQPETPEGSRQLAVGRRQEAEDTSGRTYQVAVEPSVSSRTPHARWSAGLSRMFLLPATCYLLLSALLTGCGGSGESSNASASRPAETGGVPPDPNATQQMSQFTLTGYAESGAKQWDLNGEGAVVEEGVVTIHHPSAVGYDPTRTAFLTASVAQVRQADRHVRLEHDVTIHTSDGIWFSAPILHWVPDQDQMATDTPVRIETNHMLLRGRGASGFTQLKQATLFEDIELVLNPSDRDTPGGGPKHVTITCDGPLAFDYEHDIATFKQNVHVHDPNGELYSDTLVAYLERATHTIRYAEASGRVRIYQHQNTAESERAIYEPAVGKITLVGKPSLLIYPSQESQDMRLPLSLPAAPSGAPPSSVPRGDATPPEASPPTSPQHAGAVNAP
ncbi:MAG: LPS export ABC transporter periplasmic protein LptC [Candidatus Omnitrophica bacterium]|nr:LPS export ABC transporter periplasmic protein LptC [Candidatus Omnitrophota bacterium]